VGDTFSKRHGVGAGGDRVVFDSVPEKFRIGFWNLIEDLVGHKLYPTILPDFDVLYTRITSFFRLERTHGSSQRYGIHYMVSTFLRWNEVLDLVEFLFTEVSYISFDDIDQEHITIPEKVGTARYQYTKRINELLASENVGWRLKKGKLERVGSDVLDREIIEKARKLLANPAFAGPNNQFNKALELFSKRPSPDLENCIKDAVGALEGLARILLKDNAITLGKAVDKLVGKKIIRKPFDATFHALYGFVSTEPGPRHGAYVLSSIDIAEAEFVLYNSAVSILFLANKFGIEVEVEEAPVPTSTNTQSPEAVSEESSPEPSSDDDDDVPF